MLSAAGTHARSLCNPAAACFLRSKSANSLMMCWNLLSPPALMSKRFLTLVCLLLVAAALCFPARASSVDGAFDDDEFEFSGSNTPSQSRGSSYEEEAEVESSAGAVEEDDYKPLAPPRPSDHGAARSQFREMIREKLGETLESTGNHYRSMTSRLERMQANNDFGFEIFCVALLLVFGAVYFVGARSNAAVADAWLSENSSLLQQQFKQVGVTSGSDGSLELLSDSPSCFVMHCRSPQLTTALHFIFTTAAAAAAAASSPSAPPSPSSPVTTSSCLPPTSF
jgi:hypothetical protein